VQVVTPHPLAASATRRPSSVATTKVSPTTAGGREIAASVSAVQRTVPVAMSSTVTRPELSA
jgi:hypothetical protein